MFLFVCLLDKEGMDYIVDNVGVEFDISIYCMNLIFDNVVNELDILLT